MSDDETKARPVGIDIIKAPVPVLRDKRFDPTRYRDRDFWKREWETIWTRTWQIAAMTNPFNEPGDFVTLEFGTEVILAASSGAIPQAKLILRKRPALPTSPNRPNRRRTRGKTRDSDSIAYYSQIGL